MTKILNILKSFFTALLEFSVLIIGNYYIYVYLDSNYSPSGGTDLPPVDFGPLFEFVISSLIFTIVWYVLVLFLRNRAKKRNKKIFVRANNISMILPVVFLIGTYLWFSLFAGLYNNYRHDKRIEKEENLYNYIINGDREAALDLINSEDIRNHIIVSDQNLLLIAAQKDKVVFETLLRRIKNPNLTKITYSKKNNDCFFCYLDSEENALIGITSMFLYENERGEFPNYNNDAIRLPGFCNEEDLLIFFIKKNWYKCVDKYLEQIIKNKLNRSNSYISVKRWYKEYPYDCQVVEKDTVYNYNNEIAYYNDKVSTKNLLRTVNPYDYTKDFKMKLILDKYAFKKEKNDIKEFKHIRNGDIIFQNLQSEEMEGIQRVSKSKYNNVGIVIIKNSNGDNNTYLNKSIYYVYQVSSNKLKVYSLSSWIKNGVDNKYAIKRLKNNILVTTINWRFEKEIEQNSKGYTIDSWSDNEMYSSEFVWKIYKKVLNIELGETQQLKDLNLTNTEAEKIQKIYKNSISLNDTIITSNSIFNSDSLRTILEK